MADHVAGVLLAAGAGRRMGRPKALVRDPDGTSWLLRSIAALVEGGCAPVVVVLGAAHEDAEALLSGHDLPAVRVALAADWERGMGASLRTGLGALAGEDVDSALVSLVDLPDVGAPVVRRVLAAAHGPASLARAAYGGRPGHPVLIGAEHWPGVREAASGDKGARDYLRAHRVAAVDCTELASGEDVDRPSPCPERRDAR